MPEVNRSQAIRDHFKSNPKATTQEVVDALASHGVTVTRYSGSERIVSMKSPPSRKRASTFATTLGSTRRKKEQTVRAESWTVETAPSPKASFTRRMDSSLSRLSLWRMLSWGRTKYGIPSRTNSTCKGRLWALVR